jgi:hypothetical protein
LRINNMTSPKSAKRSTTTPGVKLLITAASFAATIGGWALIGAKDNSAAQSAASSAAVPQPVSALTIKLEPLPTLVPQPTLQSQLVTASNRPVAAARPANPQPVAAAPALPALRVVTVPGGGGGGAPAAAGTTRSSK